MIRGCTCRRSTALDLRIERHPEIGLPAAVDEPLRSLLAEAFAEFDGWDRRRYFKQRPDLRFLAFEGEVLVGHVAIEHRAVGTETGPATIFGLLDVCVAERLRGRGIGRRLVTAVEAAARAADVEFLVLFADEARPFYRALGFHSETNVLRWLRIHEHRMLGLDERVVDALMVRALGRRPWPEGPVDLLGWLF